MMIEKLVTDVDGVLTDGKFTYSVDGKIYKQFGPHDSDGIKIIQDEGINIIAITADKRGFGISEKRLKDLGIELHLVREKERLKWFKENTNPKKTVFVGDGLFDIPLMKICLVSFAPINAIDLVKKFATHVINSKGGEGVLLEIAFKLLEDVNPLKLEKINNGDLE